MAATAAAFALALIVTMHYDLSRMSVGLAALALPAVAAIGFATALHWQYVLYVAGVTVLTIWFALGALQRWSTPAATAWVLFIAIAFWSGALAFIGERGQLDPKLEMVLVRQKDPAPPIGGFYLGKTSRAVYLASTQGCKDPECRRVMSIPDKQVTCLVFGPTRAVPAKPEDANPNPIDTSLADFSDAPQSVCDGATPDAATTPHAGPPVKDESRTTNRFSLINGLKIVLARPVKAAPNRLNLLNGPRVTFGQAAKPAPRTDVRMIGPFRFVFGGQPTPATTAGPRERVVLGNVVFGFGKHDLTDDAKANIAVAAREIRDSGATRVFVAGHTDAKGSDEHNVRLAKQRVAAVANELRADLPLNVKVSPRGFGERLPLLCDRRSDGSDDPEARAVNRRVEIRTRRVMTWDEPCNR
jgi:outer membrane protein OmpA-like peptidoglycan-associated protein